MKRKSSHTQTDNGPKELPFAVSDLVEFLGINPATFQQWMNRGIVPFQVIERGGRTYRRFDLDDVQIIATIGALHKRGIEPTLAKKITEDILPILYAASVSHREQVRLWHAEHGERKQESSHASLEALMAGKVDISNRLQDESDAIPEMPTFPRVACVIGDSVSRCLFGDTVEDVIKEAGSVVCLIVNLVEINDLMAKARLSAIAHKSPGFKSVLDKAGYYERT